MPSSPSTIPLSAQEAKDRLREIVEAFFFWRRSDQGRPPAPQHLVRSPPGLGKTKEAMEWATRYQTEQQGKDSILELSRSDITLAGVWAQVAIFVLRHELAQEVKEVIQRNREDLGEPVVVPVLRGRDHEADKDNAPCRRWREACELGRKGLPVYSNLCHRRHQQDVSECPYFADCEYIPAWQSAHAAPYVIPVHAHLGVGWESSRTVRGAVGLSDSDDEEEPQFDQSFNPANAAIVVCDEDPTTSLIERSRIRREDIGAITESRLGEHILAGLSTLGGILDHLREKGITAEQLRDTANKLATQERRRGQIAKPSASDAVVGNAIKLASSLVRVSRVLERRGHRAPSRRRWLPIERSISYCRSPLLLFCWQLANCGAGCSGGDPRRAEKGIDRVIPISYHRPRLRPLDHPWAARLDVRFLAHSGGGIRIAGGLLPRPISPCCPQARAWPTMRNELQRAAFPGLGKRKRAACGA